MAHEVACSLFSLAFLLCSLNQTSGDTEVYHITTESDHELCTAPDICRMSLTLPEFATNLSQYLSSNTSLVFLPGIHYLSINISIPNIDNFSLTSESVGAQIVCRNYSHIYFSNSQYISICNLEFIGCGGNLVAHVEKFVVSDTTFYGQNTSSTALEITKTSTHIINSNFKFNQNGKIKKFIAKGEDFLLYRNDFAGGAIIVTDCAISISQTRFENNGAKYGGVIFALNSIIIIVNSTFTISSADHGGVLFSLSSIFKLEASEFYNNVAEDEGGVLYCMGSTIIIKASNFNVNTANSNGGVLYSKVCNIAIRSSKFDGNRAAWYGIKVGEGGVLYSSSGIVRIEASEFYSNSGGVLYTERCSITIRESVFHNNSATSKGGILFSESSTIMVDSDIEGILFPNDSTIIIGDKEINATTYEQFSATMNGSLQIINNVAGYAVIYLSDSELKVNYSGSLKFSNNVGSLVAFNSNVTFVGYVEFKNNHPKQVSATTGTFQEGGAITLIQSNAYVHGDCNIYHNHAENGGGLLSTESKLYVNGRVTIAHNTATRNGGGVFLSNSELTCLQKSIFLLSNNHAEHKGGGLHAISSSIKAHSALKGRDSYVGTQLNFTKNIANRGGGMSLEGNAKYYILKYNPIALNDRNSINTTIFMGNSAHTYGGAVYVDDDTNSGICPSSSKTECFFQVLAVHGKGSFQLNTQSIYFSQNQAEITGSTLYGGLLDRCAVSQFAEVHYSNNGWRFMDSDHDGVGYFKNVSIPVYYTTYGEEVSIATNLSISSGPVKVCLCINNEHNCSLQAHPMKVKKGGAFNVSLVAVDQVEQPVNATIHASLKFAQSGLSEGQLITEIQGECTDLTFNVVSPHDYENLTLYADGPCKDADLSRRLIGIHFLPCSCPLGFQVSGKIEINCTCDCHSNISQYIQYCDSQNGSFIRKSQSRAWISYINDTSLTGYLIYPNCPFDYCNSFSLPVNLNQPNGADAQCAFNRSSLLCGSCQPGLSLSLSSSHCLRCPSYWPVQLIAITLAAILAGIALVALLLLLNMTVAVGSLNGVIFYANIVYANKSILLPFQEASLVTVVISWLNLELGIDTCYFPGMDTYAKIWLQLAFPAYVIFLVVVVIMISSYSMKFSKLIGKKDPVATLATLILLSYAKVLEICFESLSVGILEYPDGTSEPLWLPDATIQYLSGKHIPLFITTVLILIVGLVYTAILFSWQWLLYLPDWKISKWMRNQKLQAFIETHHVPFTPKHRYWTGLLLIIRAILYLVAAANTSNDPQLALSAIIFSVSCILLLRSYLVYRKSSINILEISFLLNLLFFSIFIWYSLSNTNLSQRAIAYTSVLIAFFVLLLIILGHVCTYTTVFSILKKTRPFQMIRGFLTRLGADQEARRHLSLPPDDDIHRFNELLDIIDRPVNTDDYRVPLLRQNPVEPIKTVVEVHQPYLPPPESEQTTSQNTASSSSDA